MKNFTYQVGIAVAKSTLDCTILQEGKKLSYQRIVNTPQAVKSYLKQLKKQGVYFTETLFCMEHTARRPLGSITLTFYKSSVKNKGLFG
ncbi:MAG: hypothetical protein AAF632_29145 [Bacteroidota bacterium]